MNKILCYGIEDKNGFLWFDDFATQEEADQHCAFVNARESIRDTCKPFKVIPITTKN